ncbi:metallophosphoesterase [Flavobacterium sp. UMI-01]|uniref:metallophosphoesterase family protein n=1 Tax=Flavobacterium sp. UMI-01 TaxID=1441053 RepID=UPI001C7D522A|nr:metallophosphoesterase [Flavobacterium sp. UMI-01]GIZ10411.1 hypothetical protein FUMI01_31350 [Flavobacterium sp. UMI-01]
MKAIPFLCLLLVPIFSIAQNNENNKNKGSRDKEKGFFYNQTPVHLYDIILARPTDNAISVSLMANENLTGCISYGVIANQLEFKTKEVSFEKGQPMVIELNKLKANTKYYYQFNYKLGPTTKEESSEVNFFHTQRKSGSSFTFTIQADSHLDENVSTEMYLKTLNNMATDSPDFLIDLGDTWMTDKYTNDFKESEKQYIAQRYYFGTLCKSAPLFLTLGNHDGEYAKKTKNGTEGNMNEWATTTRKKYYSNPLPNGFYTGNKAKVENYYAWEWGDALFIVLDPFALTKTHKEPWQRTLGETQYRWLESTLQNSKAKFRFVFVHNLVGGADNKGIARGGAEAAKFFEWGGLNSDNTSGFASNRPGWGNSIHDLFVKYKVNTVFHGHDHFFAKQDLDGIVYQLVPQPGSTRYGNINSAKEYGYLNGVIKNAPGYLRVTIEGEKAIVDYFQTSLDGKYKNKENLYSYSILPKE